jgi:hypothetical protein
MTSLGDWSHFRCPFLLPSHLHWQPYVNFTSQNFLDSGIDIAYVGEQLGATRKPLDHNPISSSSILLPDRTVGTLNKRPDEEVEKWRRPRPSSNWERLRLERANIEEL